MEQLIRQFRVQMDAIFHMKNSLLSLSAATTALHAIVMQSDMTEENFNGVSLGHEKTRDQEMTIQLSA